MGIVLNSNGTLDVQSAVIRYAGSSGSASVYTYGGSLTLTDTLISDSSGPALNLNGHNTPPSIDGCQLNDNAT